MSRAAARVVVGIAIVLLLGGLAWWLLAGHGPRSLHGPGETAAAPAQKMVLSADLYFPADGGTLGVERRQIQTTGAPKDQVRGIVEALLAGPQKAGLVRPLPAEVGLGGVVLTGDGIAYVDLHWADHDEPPAGGSTEEMQRVYSLVNSIALNVPQAPRVVLLWNGLQRPSFSGHLDTSGPLAPSRDLAL